MRSVFAKLVLLLAACTAGSAKAADIPAQVFGKYVKKKPSCYWHMDREICEGFHWDTVEIKRKTAVSAYVSIETKTVNGHGCAFYGIGRWKENSLSVVGKPSDYEPRPESLDRESTPQEWGVCRVAITKIGDSVTYDVATPTANFCRSSYCSARGSLHFIGENARPIYERKK